MPVLMLLLLVLLLALIYGWWQYRKLRQHLLQHQTLLDSIPDLAWVKDRDGRFVIVNRAFCDIWQVKDQDKLLGLDDFALSPRDLAQRYRDDDLSIMQSGQAMRSEHNYEHAIEGHRWMELIKVPVRTRNGQITGTAGIARDISERKAAEQQLRWLAGHDPLTGLANRALLEQALNSLIEHKTPFCLWLIDLDHFKRINDALGHGAGDQALTELGRRLAKINPRSYRLGGDEFVLIGRPEEEHTLGHALPELTREPVKLDGLDFELGFTAGLVHYPRHGETASTLMQHADIALYEGKRQGRGQVCAFSQPMASRASQQLQLERDLRRALRENEFWLAYQPQVNLADGRITGLEALLRWQHPQHGLVPPNEFIPFAEQTGIICAIGDWVFDEVCSQLLRWHQQGLPLVPVSLNVSPLQLEQSDFVEARLAVLDTLPPALRSMLAIELTESALTNGPELARVHTLCQHGIALYMDDFGTGYSNLARLPHLPLSKLKFDRSLVNRLPERPEQQAICRAMVQLAHSLHLDIVAEGVEHADELAWLQQLGVNSAQGYWFSRPRPAREIEAWLRAGTALPASDAS